jgi:hypothetical protein
MSQANDESLYHTLITLPLVGWLDPLPWNLFTYMMYCLETCSGLEYNWINACFTLNNHPTNGSVITVWCFVCDIYTLGLLFQWVSTIHIQLHVIV